MKHFIPCPRHKIYRVEAVKQNKNKKQNKTKQKNKNKKRYSCEYVKFGAISWKIDILSITA